MSDNTPTATETKTKRVAKTKVAKTKVDKYNGFKVPPKSRSSTKWAFYIYDMIKEAKPALLENIAVRDAYNNLIDCLIKYEVKLETWIPAKYQKYSTGIKLKKDGYTELNGIPGRWKYSWTEQNDPIIRPQMKAASEDIIKTYTILYDLIKRDVVPYMEIKDHEIKSKKDIEYYHRCMEKLENDIKTFERSITSHRKTLGEYAAKCIALQNPPNLTKFD
jgi:hypothetical protein